VVFGHAPKRTNAGNEVHPPGRSRLALPGANHLREQELIKHVGAMHGRNIGMQSKDQGARTSHVRDAHRGAAQVASKAASTRPRHEFALALLAVLLATHDALEECAELFRPALEGRLGKDVATHPKLF